MSAPSGFVSRSPSGPQVEAADSPVLKEDPQATKHIEKFDIPLDSLKRMFEKPAVTNTVSAALLLWQGKCPASCSLCPAEYIKLT